MLQWSREKQGGQEKQVEKEINVEWLWTASEETILTLAREIEWAEAYAEDYPGCLMGSVYLDFLRRELVTAQGEI